MKPSRASLSFATSTLALALVDALPAQEPTVAELKQRIAQLEAEVETLSAQLEGTAAPINLARTSLGAVSASSVNGNRPLDNKFYGALNLFDEDTNRHGGIAYPYWLSDAEERPWVEVRFQVPVAVAAIEVDGGPAFTAKLIQRGGGEETLPAAEKRLALPTPRRGVVAVRVTFDSGGQQPCQVAELRVLGHAPPEAAYRVGLPAVQLTRAHAVAVARERYQAWQAELLGSPTEQVAQRADGSWEVRFARGGKDLLVVVIGKDGEVTTDPRASLQ